MHRVFESSEFPTAQKRKSGGIAVPQFLRSQGEIDLSFRTRNSRSAVDRSYQAGCLRMRLPRRESAVEPPCAVLINTAGGVAEGDALHYRIGWDECAAAAVTTQAAEKVYRALATGSTIATSISVGRRASAEWLPQETILFDGFRLRRETRIILEEGVTFLGVEALVLGRTAMGESVRTGSLRDRLRIWRNGQLIYADAQTLEGDVAAFMQRSPIGAGARAMAVLVHASDQAGAFLEPVRDVLLGARGRAAASCWNGLLVVRILAPDGETLRHDISAALCALRGGRPLPRVWRC